MAKYAESGDKQWEDKRNEKPLSVDVKVTFPDAEIFGVKMVNGRPTRALLHVTNNEEVPVNALVAVGALLTPSNTPGAPDPPVVMRNLTGAKFDTLVQPKTTETLTYAFATIMHPQDLTLELKTMISRGPRVFTVTAFSESVSIVEAPVSILDPQMYVDLTLMLSMILTTFAASSSTPSSSRHSAVLATLSTTPGSQPSSLRRSAVARAASVRSVRLEAPSQSTHLSRSLCSMLTAPLSRLARRVTTRAGFPLRICRDHRPSVLAREGRRVGLHERDMCWYGKDIHSIHNRWMIRSWPASSV